MDTITDPTLGKIEALPDGKFKAPDNIVKNITSSRAIYLRLRTDHLLRINTYTEIYGLIQGNPPYDPNELKAAGLEHMSNFNDMSARAVFERACLAYWNLLLNSQTMTRFVLRLPKEFDSAETTFWAQIMARNWDFAVKNYWRSFVINMASLTSQLVMFGLSPILFPDERDPKWRVVELNRFLVPNQAQSDLDQLTTVMVESEFTIQYLWGVYTQFKDKPAGKSPWNVKVLGDLLARWGSSVIKDQTTTFDVLDLEKRMMNGDISYDRAYSDTLKIVSEFQKEYSGKVSHYMFHRDFTGTVSTGTTDDFIFFEKDQYQDISEALVIFTMNPGEFTLHANRGLGHKIYSLSQAKIQLDCAVVDGAKNASTIFIKSSSLSTKDAEQIRWNPGAPTNLGSAELVPNNVGANINAAIGAAQYVASLIQFNMTYSGSDPGQPDPSNSSISPTQARLQAFREFAVLKNYIMHFQNTVDYVVQNMTAKMLRSQEGWPNYEMARIWKERCIQEGVPPQVFELQAADKKSWRMPSHIEVYVTRVAGSGSQVAQLMGLQEIKEIINSFGTKAQMNFQRDFITAALGPESIDAYMESPEERSRQTNGASEAALENGMMKLGQQVLFSPDNDQRAHIMVHLQDLTQVVQATVQQQMSPIEADKVFELGLPHLSQHVQFEQNNPFSQSFMAEVMPGFNQVQQYANLNKKNAAKMLQAQQRKQLEQQQATQQAMSEEELKTMQVTNDERRKDFKLTSQLERQREQQDTKAQALDEKTSADIRIKNKKVEGELAIAARKNGTNNPGQELANMGGQTPAPFDIETQRPVVSGFEPRYNPKPPVI